MPHFAFGSEALLDELHRHIFKCSMHCHRNALVECSGSSGTTLTACEGDNTPGPSRGTGTPRKYYSMAEKVGPARNDTRRNRHHRQDVAVDETAAVDL